MNLGKGNKDRVVPFPLGFRETLALHIEHRKQRGGNYLFESSWKRHYSDRGIRRMLEPRGIRFETDNDTEAGRAENRRVEFRIVLR